MLLYKKSSMITLRQNFDQSQIKIIKQNISYNTFYYFNQYIRFLTSTTKSINFNKINNKKVKTFDICEKILNGDYNINDKDYDNIINSKYLELKKQTYLFISISFLD